MLESKGIYENQIIFKIYDGPLNGDDAYCINGTRIITVPKMYLPNIYVEIYNEK